MSAVPNLRINVLTSPDRVSEFWEWLTRPGRAYVAFDTETTGLTWWTPDFRIRLAQFGDAAGGWAIPFEGWPSLVAGALQWCSENRVRVVMHNGIGFDALALRSQGIDLDWSILDDTMVMAAVSGYADQDRMLKHLAMRDLGSWAGAGDRLLKTGMKNAGWTWADVPLDWKPYPLYGVVDTCITALLWERWADRRRDWAGDHALEVATSRIVNNMQWNGVATDGVYLNEQIDLHEEREEQIAAQLKTLGITNPAQNGQLEVLLKKDGFPLEEKTASGKAKLDKDVLEHIDHPAAKLVQQYRWNHRVLVSYLRPIFEGSGAVLGTGTLHPNIKPIEARTGRMSVENPPMQQLPSDDPVVRRAIVGRDPVEDVVLSSDYGQIELRLWGAINGDQALVDTIKTADEIGGDFFVEVGKAVYGEPDFKKADPRRRQLKSTIYAKLFAGGIETAAAQAGVNVYSLVPTWKLLEQTYPSLQDLGNKLIETRKTPQGDEHVITSRWGREFKVRDAQERRKLGNYVTQGSAAITLKKALVSLDAAGFGPHMMLPVHDEIVMSVSRAEAEEAKVEVAACMDAIIDANEWGIAVTAEPGIGVNWAEAH